MPQPLSSPTSQEELNAPLMAFGVADGQILKVLKSDAKSTVFLVQSGADTAENPQRTLVLKGTQKTAAEAFDSFEMLGLTARVQNRLHQIAGEILTPGQLQTPDGKFLWSSQGDARVWSLGLYIEGRTFDWLLGGGDTPSWTEADCLAAGKLLARLHCAGRHVKKGLSAADSEALQSIVPNFSDPHVQAVLASEQTIVHGDFHPGNVLFCADADKPAVAIDFAYAHLEHPLYDLAYAWLMFAEPFGLISQKQQEVAAAALLSGYRQHYTEVGTAPPSFLPGNAAEFGSPSGSTPLNQFAVICANLLLSWTKSPEGKENARASTLAKRMNSRIQTLDHSPQTR